MYVKNKKASALRGVAKRMPQRKESRSVPICIVRVLTTLVKLFHLCYTTTNTHSSPRCHHRSVAGIILFLIIKTAELQAYINEKEISFIKFTHFWAYRVVKGTEKKAKKSEQKYFSRRSLKMPVK